MACGSSVQILDATARTYRDGRYDECEKYLCPSCNKQNRVVEEFVNRDDRWEAIETCMYCGARVRVTYRRMFRKNY